MTIVLEAGAVRRGLADIAAAGEVLDEARTTATRQVDDLMTRWHGEAAESFAAAYAAWAGAADDLGARLATLHSGIAAARAALGSSDDATAAGVAVIAGRLG